MKKIIMQRLDFLQGSLSFLTKILLQTFFYDLGLFEIFFYFYHCLFASKKHQTLIYRFKISKINILVSNFFLHVFFFRFNWDVMVCFYIKNLDPETKELKNYTKNYIKWIPLFLSNDFFLKNTDLYFFLYRISLNFFKNHEIKKKFLNFLQRFRKFNNKFDLTEILILKLPKMPPRITIIKKILKKFKVSFNSFCQIIKIVRFLVLISDKKPLLTLIFVKKFLIQNTKSLFYTKNTILRGLKFNSHLVFCGKKNTISGFSEKNIFTNKIKNLTPLEHYFPLCSLMFEPSFLFNPMKKKNLYFNQNLPSFFLLKEYSNLRNRSIIEKKKKDILEIFSDEITKFLKFLFKKNPQNKRETLFLLEKCRNSGKIFLENFPKSSLYAFTTEHCYSFLLLFVFKNLNEISGKFSNKTKEKEKTSKILEITFFNLSCLKNDIIFYGDFWIIKFSLKKLQNAKKRSQNLQISLKQNLVTLKLINSNLKKKPIQLETRVFLVIKFIKKALLGFKIIRDLIYKKIVFKRDLKYYNIRKTMSDLKMNLLDTLIFEKLKKINKYFLYETWNEFFGKKIERKNINGLFWRTDSRFSLESKDLFVNILWRKKLKFHFFLVYFSGKQLTSILNFNKIYRNPFLICFLRWSSLGSCLKFKKGSKNKLRTSNLRKLSECLMKFFAFDKNKFIFSLKSKTSRVLKKIYYLTNKKLFL